MAQRFILNKSKHLAFKPYKKTIIPRNEDKVDTNWRNENKISKIETTPSIEKKVVANTPEVVEGNHMVTENITVEEPKKKVIVRSRKKEESDEVKNVDQ